ncbi:hypothetical protein PMAYCL1PPCAC_05603, partial [Pristionchus mayeri]
PPKQAKIDGELVEPEQGCIRFGGEVRMILKRGIFANDTEVVGPLWWSLMVKKNASSHLGVYLVHRTYETRPWSVNVSAQFKLVGAGDEGNRECELKTTFHNGCTRAGINEFIPWDDLVDKNKGYLNKDRIVIEVRFTPSNVVGISPEIDFTDSDEPLHDVALVFNGGKLYASKQILSIHSPVFNAMFFGNFIEKNKNEIKLKDVDREDFKTILFMLYHPSRLIEVDMRLLESILMIADRYDFKEIVDRVEEVVLIDVTNKISMADKLIFVDKHDYFRFIKLHTEAFSPGYGNDYRKLHDSDEYDQLSEAAKSACDRISEMLSADAAYIFPFWSRSSGECAKMKEHTNSLETNDLVASGCFPTIFDMEWEEGGILSSTIANHEHHWNRAIAIGGLMWSVDAKCDVLEDADGEERHLLSLKLIVNQDRPSKFDWTAEGIMEIEATFDAKGGITLMDQSDPTYSTELVNDKGNPINPFSMNPFPIRKKFTFALDSNNRMGMTPVICVIKRDEDIDNGEEEDPKMFVKTRIYLTKVTGVRKTSQFDFTSAVASSDTILIVEEKELHVHKQYLSAISTVFRTMFEDGSSGIGNRYELKGVKYRDFVEFLRWIYPPFVKNFDEGCMSRMAAFAKKFNVPFVFAQIGYFLHNIHCFDGLKMVLYFGYDCVTQFCCNDDGQENIDWKSLYREIENTPAYKAMDDGKAREMLDWMMKSCSKTDVSP